LATLHDCPRRGHAVRNYGVTCLTTRPHWLLASLFRFQGAVCSTPVRARRSEVPNSMSAEPTLTALGLSRPVDTVPRGGPASSVRVNPPGTVFPADW
jgi:hypothetical protein